MAGVRGLWGSRSPSLSQWPIYLMIQHLVLMAGVMLKYIMAGCPLFLSNLWNVTYCGTDHYMEAQLQGWFGTGPRTPHSLLCQPGPPGSLTQVSCWGCTCSLWLTCLSAVTPWSCPIADRSHVTVRPSNLDLTLKINVLSDFPQCCIGNISFWFNLNIIRIHHFF